MVKYIDREVRDDDRFQTVEGLPQCILEFQEQLTQLNIALPCLKSLDSEKQVLAAPRLGARKYKYKNLVGSIFLSIITNTQHYIIMSDPYFKIKNNSDLTIIGVNDSMSVTVPSSIKKNTFIKYYGDERVRQ